jgi:hypothetical protein
METLQPVWDWLAAYKKQARNMGACGLLAMVTLSHPGRNALSWVADIPFEVCLQLDVPVPQAAHNFCQAIQNVTWSKLDRGLAAKNPLVMIRSTPDELRTFNVAADQLATQIHP